MFVVALTRWGAPLETELVPLAAALGEQPYDLRAKLAGALPAVAYRGPDVTRAQAVLGVLRDRRHGALAVDLGQVGESRTMFSPRRVRLDADCLWMEQGVTSLEVGYGDLLAVIHAMHTQSTDASHVTTESKVSLGRAALTGGVMWTKSKTTTTNAQRSEGEQVLYLFRRDGTHPALLRQGNLRVEGGDGPAPRTSLEALSNLVSALRQRAPRALYDNRLLTNKRRPTIVSHVSQARTTTTTHDNFDETDLAAHLLALAHLKGEL